VDATLRAFLSLGRSRRRPVAVSRCPTVGRLDLVPSAQPRVIALVPAHNEAATIRATVEALQGQDHAISRIIVIADNCVDPTVSVARSAGAIVAPTVSNVHRKAGALNQTLDVVLPQLEPHDHVLIVDADSEINTSFVTAAVGGCTGAVGAVGGVFFGHHGGGLLAALQRNEYLRYARDIARGGDRAKVLTGTATLFRVEVLRDVASARGEVLPGTRGDVFDARAITEDNEITLAVKTLGYDCISPPGCTVVTELMPTWRDLWRQRVRWQRGALDNLREYGVTRVTTPYVAKQLLMGLGAVVFVLYLAMLCWGVLAGGRFTLSPFWLSLGGLFIVERAWTVRSGGRRAVGLAAAR
jgi:cellulose synthase/poly-beta-1,6-N-acetylglucosamine synthase-like glycosyltransferase